MSWTKQEFIDFCSKCGIDPSKAMKEGKVDLSAAQRQKMAEGANITNKKIKRRKINAVKAILKIQNPERKSDTTMALDQEVCGENGGLEAPAGRIRISITGYRVRPLDEDNFCAGCKNLIDGIVQAGVVPGDNWATLQVRTRQEKVSGWAKEGTLVELDFP